MTTGMIALIGGSGFIGTRLAKRLLASGKQVRILDIAPSRFFPEHRVYADVCDEASLVAALEGCDTIINLAAQHRDNVLPRSLYDQVNVDGARNVCSAAARRNIRSIVFTSSVAVYGFASPNTDEEGRLNPFNDYGRTKMMAEQIYRSWFAEDSAHRSLVIVRPTVVFGERNRGNVYNLLKMISGGRFVMVGGGENVKSMAFVENVAAFLEFCLNLERGEHLFNYVDKPDFTMKDLVGVVRSTLYEGRKPRKPVAIPYTLGYAVGMAFDLLGWITRRQFAISSIRIRKFCATTQFAADRAFRTGFVPPVPLQEAIERTVRFEFMKAAGTEAPEDNITFESE